MDIFGLVVQSVVSFISFISIFVILFVARTRSVFIFETWLILAAQLCFFFSGLANILLYFLPPENTAQNIELAFQIGASGTLILFLGYYLYLLLVFRFTTEHPPLLASIFPTLLFGGAILLVLIGNLTYEYVPASDKWIMSGGGNYFGITLGIMSYYVGIYSLVQLGRMIRQSSPQNKKPLRIFFVGFFLAFIVANFFFSGPSNPNSLGGSATALFSDLPFVFIGIGVALFPYGYLKSPTFGFIVGHKIYHLYVVNSAGIPLYSTAFEQDVAGEYSADGLIGGALTGIAALMEESLRGRAIQSIRFANKEVILKGEDGYFIMVVVERSSGILQSCLKEFADEFRRQFGEAARAFSGALDQFAGVNPLIDRSFRLLGKTRQNLPDDT